MKPKNIQIAEIIGDGFDWVYWAKFGLRNYSNEVALGYIKEIKKSIKKAENMLFEKQKDGVVE